MNKPPRIASLDILRGIAIFIMVAANSAALLIEPHPHWYRWYGSIAAFIFVALAGFMVAYTTTPLKQIFIRASLFLAVGAFIDVACYKMVPFLGADILYILAVGIFAAFAAKKYLTSTLTLVTSIAIVFAAPMLRSKFGYINYPTEIPLETPEMLKAVEFGTVVRHWFVDGWYPLFPWLGFLLFGVYVAQKWKQDSSFADKNSTLFTGIGVLAFGIVSWLLYPGPMIKRIDYSEVFYPAVTGFSFISCGAFLVFLNLVHRTEKLNIWNPFAALGQCSMLMYIVHLFVINYLLRAIFQPMEMAPYLFVYLGFASFLIALSQNIRNWKQKRAKPLPYLAKFFLGS